MSKRKLVDWFPLRTAAGYTLISLLALQLVPCVPELFGARSYGWPFVSLVDGFKGVVRKDGLLRLSNIGFCCLLGIATITFVLRLRRSLQTSTFSIAGLIKLTLYSALVIAVWLSRYEILHTVLIAKGYDPAAGHINWQAKNIPWILLPGIWLGLICFFAWVGVGIDIVYRRVSQRT